MTSITASIKSSSKRSAFIIAALGFLLTGTRLVIRHSLRLTALAGTPFLIFSFWPLVPGLLWNWTEKTDLAALGTQITQRLHWLAAIQGIGTLVWFGLFIGVIVSITLSALNEWARARSWE